jgi:hypothetical protein
LLRHRFDAVLHGHKHHPRLMWDYLQRSDGGLEEIPRRLLVTSAPSPDSYGEPFGRLLRLGQSLDGRPYLEEAPRLEIETILASRRETGFSTQEREQVFLAGVTPSNQDPPFVAIHAQTAQQAYERLQQRTNGKDATNVICVVEDAASASELPQGYPAPDGVAPGQWLEDAVTWWQKAVPRLVRDGDAPFNHGERLFQGSQESGPLIEAARRLGRTRAFVNLVRPREPDGKTKFPAFVAVQLVLTGARGRTRLDCVGFFRKQDLNLWWPVNIAELRRIQETVLEHTALRTKPDAGRLVTIAVVGVHEAVLPELAGTLIDRTVDLRPDDILRMAYAVANPDKIDKTAMMDLWRTTLADIADPTQVEGLPSLGLAELIGHVKALDGLSDQCDLSRLESLLEDLYGQARDGRHVRRDSSKQRRERAGRLARATQRVLEEVTTLLS